MFSRFKRRKLDKDGKKEFVEDRSERGEPNQLWLDEHNLNHHSPPHEFFSTYSNHKSLLENAGQEGKLYPDFTDFKVKEIRQFIGARMVHGLAPAPRLQMKFRM